MLSYEPLQAQIEQPAASTSSSAHEVATSRERTKRCDGTFDRTKRSRAMTCFRKASCMRSQTCTEHDNTKMMSICCCRRAQGMVVGKNGPNSIPTCPLHLAHVRKNILDGLLCLHGCRALRIAWPYSQLAASWKRREDADETSSRTQSRSRNFRTERDE